jgi:hypothetical protein
MAMCWSYGIPRAAAGAALALALCGLLLAQRLPRLEKPRKHGLGFSYALPKDWKSEDGSEAVLLLPPGVTVDAEREDNPEIYLVEEPEGLNDVEDPGALDWLKAAVLSADIQVEREYGREVFTSPGKPGAIYTLDLLAGKRALRVRAFIVKSKGKLLMLRASGDRQRVISREWTLRAIASSLEW